MNAMLEQFLSESRDFLQGIGEKLMQLENDPADAGLMTELFRFVHTLKGNSGLFDFPEMTRVLHAAEDLMDAVRSGETAYSRALADRLLDAADFIGMLCDEIEEYGGVNADHAQNSARLAAALRSLISRDDEPFIGEPEKETPRTNHDELAWLADIPEHARMEAFRRSAAGEQVHLLNYCPAEDCFFQGDDPLYQAKQTPGLIWGKVAARESWPKPADLDAYRCVLVFRLLSVAPRDELDEYYRYLADQITILPVARDFVFPQGSPDGGGPLHEDFIRETLPRNIPSPREKARAERQTADSKGVFDKETDALRVIIETQREILAMPDNVAWFSGRIKAVAASLAGCLHALGETSELPGLETATGAALNIRGAAPLLAWLNSRFPVEDDDVPISSPAVVPAPAPAVPEAVTGGGATAPVREVAPEIKFARRADDNLANLKSLKVDQSKIDRLMNLIGEIVVAKNALPYLAARAEAVFGVRELSRDIKSQYAVINRIAEEMQDSIMQVRMLPVSFIFQRFPRLVRDISHKLQKEVDLILEGEETEADKTIVEALGDPLMHIVRNSLDHGIELPAERLAAGKPALGTLKISASQESYKVVLEISDDGKGIDPEVIKRKAYEKGIIDEERLARISNLEALHLVFAAGFSTAETISDLSGRGVGMDVVRTAIEKVNGAIHLESEKGKGTRIRLSLPLTMAVTNVMIIEANGQLFGVPIGCVVETVRVQRSDIRVIKKQRVAVLRGRIVPLKALNTLLGIHAPPKVNEDEEFAVLVVSVGYEAVGILVDGFRETVDIILKPMTGVMGSLTAYAGSALMGDGSVLMVLNIKEIL